MYHPVAVEMMVREKVRSLETYGLEDQELRQASARTEGKLEMLRQLWREVWERWGLEGRLANSGR